MMTGPGTPSKSLDHPELVRAAILAPTPDNNQPWLFASGAGELRVYLDPARSLPSDVNSMFDLVGLGAAVENIVLAARHAGFAANVDYGPASGGPGGEGDARLVARLNFDAGSEPDPLFAHLGDRCTCRKMYSTRPIAPECLERLSAAAGAFSETQLDWVTDRSRIRAIARLIAGSDRIRFEYEPFHNEIFRQLRFSAEEAEQTRDGLDLRTLEMPPGAGVLLRMLKPWSRMKWIHRLGLGGLLTLPSVLAVLRSGAIGVLSLPSPSATAFLRGGQAFQRLWLAAQAEQLALQPLGSPAIFFAHVEQLQGQRLCQRHTARVRQLIQRFGSLIPSIGNRTVLILFRLGHAARPGVRSLRREADCVFDSSKTAT